MADKYLLSNGAVVYDKAYYFLDIIKVNLQLFSGSIYSTDVVPTFGSDYVNYRSKESIKTAVNSIINQRLKGQGISYSDVIFSNTGVQIKFNYSGSELKIELEYIDMNENLV